jgi:transposase InsO family protein
MIQGLQTGGNMGRKPRVDRSPEEKWQIVQEGLKSGNLSETCRRDALTAVEQAVLERLPAGSRSANLTLTTNNGTQFTSSRFLETLARLGITHRRTAYHHPEGNSYIERFHRSLKEEEAWAAEFAVGSPH